MFGENPRRKRERAASGAQAPAPRRKWRGGLPPLPGASGSSPRRPIRVVPAKRAFSSLKRERRFIFWNMEEGQHERQHQKRQRPAQPVFEVLSAEEPRRHPQRFADPGKRPNGFVHHRWHAPAGALSSGREAPHGHAADGCAEVHPHRRHRRRGRPQPPHLL